MEGLRGERKQKRVSEPSARNVSKSVLWRPHPSPQPAPILLLSPAVAVFVHMCMCVCVEQTFERFLSLSDSNQKPQEILNLKQSELREIPLHG